jgi:hypothetical protein
MRRSCLASVAAVAAACSLFATAAPASAGEEIPSAADYPGMTTFKCRSNQLPISPGQNLNLFDNTTTCPNAKKVKGSGPVKADIFNTGASAQGYVTRFKPSMQEVVKKKGKTDRVTPSVWDLHLHHVVWIKGDIFGGGNPTFASGEEKTIVRLPQGYGQPTGSKETWGLNYMIHSLNASSGRKVEITWQIDWVPETSPARTDIEPSNVQWLDVAGYPQIYPVFDAERDYDTDTDGDFVFPDDAEDPGDPAYAEENEKISNRAQWVVPSGGRTLVFGAGHLHPGGLSVDLEVARDGDDGGTVDGDSDGEVKPLFRSDAKYYEPAGAVSWDVSMEATRPDWRIKLKAGDTVSVNSTYDVSDASWYESMGIMPLAVSTASDPEAKDPFDDEAAVQDMYEDGGILTHGRLPENIDSKARKDLGLPDPTDLPSNGTVSPSGIEIDGFVYQQGGYTANKHTPEERMRPPTVTAGDALSFKNLEAVSGQPDEQQVWHSITSCQAPCNKGSGIGYPLADGPVKFDSGQLGYGTLASAGVTTGSNEYTIPAEATANPGTYTYFCRIHPLMRGSFRVE